jgi:hypothetical protein
MKAIRVFSCALLVLLTACGHRQPAQQANQGASPAAADPAQPGPTQTAQTPAQLPPLEGTPAPDTGPNQPATSGGGAPANQQAAAYQQGAANQQAPANQPAPAQQQVPAYRQAPANALVIPAGAVFHVRLDESLDTKHNRPGDRFYASLMRPVVVNGFTVVPRGTRCTGHLVESKPSGRFRGHAEMSLRLDAFELKGRSYAMWTGALGSASGGHKKRDWALMGGGSGFGTVVGAIGGGPVGALIGAGAGGAAGTVGEAITGRKNVRLPVETPLAFSLRAPVRVRS